MKLLFLILILFILFFYRNYEGIDLLNIYGEPLQPCRNIDGDNKGSWDDSGFCSEMDGGVHQICFTVNNSTLNFSEDTYQSEWSKSRVNKNHCMCLGAWALYKAKNKGNNNELVCESIAEMALNPRYINAPSSSPFPK